MRRITSFLPALALTLFLLCPAASAAGAPTLWMESGSGTGNVPLTLQGLGNQTVNSVQLELTFGGSYPRASFTMNGGSYSYCRVEESSGQTTVTIYADSLRNLNQTGTVNLGTLSLGGGYTAPSSARLTILNRNLELSSGSTIPVRTGQGTVSGGTSSGGTSSGDTDSSTGRDNVQTALPFTDVKEGVWFHDAVAYAYANGLMSGTGASTFSPDLPTSRGMIVTILYRLAGSPEAGSSGFTDVADGQYYAKAVAWAAANGVVSGYGDGTFGPNDPITREQLAVILWHYAGSPPPPDLLLTFSDAGTASGYATDALRWAVDRGLINGTSPTTLTPRGTATRAQAAVILKGFCQNVLGLD